MRPQFHLTCVVKCRNGARKTDRCVGRGHGTCRQHRASLGGGPVSLVGDTLFSSSDKNTDYRWDE